MVVHANPSHRTVVKSQDARRSLKQKPADKNQSNSENGVVQPGEDKHLDKIKIADSARKTEENNNDVTSASDNGHDFFILNLMDNEDVFSSQSFYSAGRAYNLVQYYVAVGQSIGVKGSGLIGGVDNVDRSPVFTVLQSVFEERLSLPRIDLLGLFNAAPTVQNSLMVIDEDIPLSGTLVGSDREGQPLTFSVVQQALHGSLVLNPNGTYVYTPHSNFNGEDTFTFKANDGFKDSANASVTITINPVNDPPAINDFFRDSNNNSILDPQISENNTGAIVGYLSAQDPEGDSFSWSIVDVVTPFELVGTMLKLKDGVSLDYESDGDSIEVTIQAQDVYGLVSKQTFSIALIDLNEIPVLSPGLFNQSGIQIAVPTVNENDPGAIIGYLSVTDPDGDAIIWSVSDNRFEVVDGALKLKNSVSLNYEAENTIEVEVQAEDGRGGSDSQTFHISVQDVNEAPTDITLSNFSVNEIKTDVVVGTLSSIDPDAGDSVTFSVVNDSRFTIDGNNLKLVSPLDYETLPNHQTSVTIRATDAQGATYDKDLIISVNDVNENPPKILGYTDNAGTTYTIDYSTGGDDGGVIIIVFDDSMFTAKETGVGNTWQVNMEDSGFPENYSYSLSVNATGLTEEHRQILANSFAISNTGLITQISAIDDQLARYVPNLFNLSSIRQLWLDVTVTDLDNGLSQTQPLKIKITDVPPAISSVTDGVTSYTFEDGQSSSTPPSSGGNGIILPPIINILPTPLFTENENDINKTWQLGLRNTSPYETYTYSLDFLSSSNPGLSEATLLMLKNSFAISSTGLITQIKTIDINDVSWNISFQKYILTLQVTVTDAVTLASGKQDITIGVNDVAGEVTQTTLGTSTVIFRGFSYANTSAGSLLDASKYFNINTTEKILYHIDPLYSLQIDPNTGLVYGSIPGTVPTNVVLNVRVFTADDDVGDDFGTDISAYLSVQVLDIPSITSSQSYFLVARNDFNNGMFGDLANLSSRNLSFHLDSGMPGKIINYYNGTYAYLNYNVVTESSGLTSSPQLVTGSMFVDGISHRFAFNVTNVVPLALDFSSSFSNFKNGGTGGTGGAGTAFDTGATGSYGGDGISFQQIDTSSQGIIKAPDVGNAGNGGNGGLGGRGGNAAVFEDGDPGGTGGRGGDGGDITYKLDNSAITTDQIIIGGDTGNAGLGGSAGAHGVRGNNLDAGIWGSYSGGVGGVGGSGGNGGDIDYYLIGGSGNDTILLGKAGYSLPSAFAPIGSGQDGIGGRVFYSVEGGAGNDYFIINQLPTPNPDQFEKSGTVVSVQGGEGDDVADLQVDFFTFGRYGSLYIDGGNGFNSLIVHNDLGRQLYFNDDNPFSYGRIRNINLIDLQDASTLTISPTDIDNIVAADSNGVHTLFVNGTTAPGGIIIGGSGVSAVELYNAPSGFNFNNPTSTVSMGTILYDSYQIDSNTVLNIQQGVGHMLPSYF
ncbi:MAG: cadherin-like domain-containing protein [Candidatus Paracaedibacteraceae bacterium]|nr:cadherin-like domain-containing protein [Candidatus Paracaedibacteraceae bacterium]